MKLFLLAGLVYTGFGAQCIGVLSRHETKCEAISGSSACGTDTDCRYISNCADNPNGNLCKRDAACYWTGKTCVADTGCGAAPTKAQCNLKTHTDGFPCGYDVDLTTCERRTCAHSGKSKGWCLKYNGGNGPQCKFASQQCWDLPSGETAVLPAAEDATGQIQKKAARCTSDKPSKRMKCAKKVGSVACTSVAEDECKYVTDPTGPAPPAPGKCEFTGTAEAKAIKCKRKKGCRVDGSNCLERSCADYSKNQFTCHFKSKKADLNCVMDGTTCRAGRFSDADMIAKPCSVNTQKRVCHAQVKSGGGPRCEYNNDDGVCRDAVDKTCGDSNRKECRALKNSTPGQGCWWLGPELRCLDSTTASCTILPKNRCKKVAKFKAHFGLTCALNKSNNQCYNNQVTCGDVTSGRFCVEHANCSWTGTVCVDYASNPVTPDASDSCQEFNKKTCKTWVDNCFWYQGYNNGAGLCVVQPGASSP